MSGNRDFHSSGLRAGFKDQKRTWFTDESTGEDRASSVWASEQGEINTEGDCLDKHGYTRVRERRAKTVGSKEVVMGSPRTSTITDLWIPNVPTSSFCQQRVPCQPSTGPISVKHMVPSRGLVKTPV